MKEFIRDYIADLKTCLDDLDTDSLEKVKDLLLKAYTDKKQIFICGNGGSATTASHFACDLGKGTTVDFADSSETRFRVVALTDNIATLTAYANDNSYEDIFKEQLVNLIGPGDVVIGISASGNSENVVRALKLAKEKGATSASFVGFSGGKCKDVSDISVYVKNDHYGVVEDMHLVIMHLLSYYLKEEKKKA
jgi:D-sedoheptulose 7-phosphate isomerase